MNPTAHIPVSEPARRSKAIRRRREALLRAAAHLALAVIGLAMLLPLLWMLSTSLKPAARVLTFPPRWLPTVPTTAVVGGRERELVEVTQGGRTSRAAIVGLRPAGLLLQPLAGGPRFLRPDGPGVRHLQRWAPHWRNYLEAWGALKVESGFFGLLRNADGFLVFYLNSLFVAVVVTAGQVATSSLAAYAFARLRFPGRDMLFLGYLATLMVPSVVTMIPVFALMRRMALTDTYWALILPGVFSAYGTFLLRQFFLTLPRELEDAARIDGAGRFTIYHRIILPLSKPALATLVTFVFLHSWNDFMWPVIVIDDLGKKTLPIGLAHFQTPFLTEWHLLMAASVIVMVPVLVVFVAGQRYFVRGLVLSGIKG